MRWIFQDESDPQAVSEVRRMLTTNEVFPEQLAELLVNKGLTQRERIQNFFRPSLDRLHDPMRMKDMDKAVIRIMKALENGEKILVYGDYDVDGTTSVSMMTLAFRDWGIDHDFYIPDRDTEGYGISYKGMDYAHKIGAGLVIALDCGTKAVEKIKYANTKGVDVIVCDHHLPGAELPPVVALLNPKQEGCAYPFKELTGCGIGFKLLCAIWQAIEDTDLLPNLPESYEIFSRFGDLVALSTACDIVPVEGENRILLFHGVRKMRNNPLPGLAALMDLSERERPWNVSDLLFFIGPRINSAGRLSSARKAVELLTGNDGGIAAQANSLHASNVDRQLLDKSITQEGLQMIWEEEKGGERNSTVLFKEDWHKGVIGIVASRLIETYYRPTILMTKTEMGWVGSGRSVRGFDLYQALEACQDQLVQFGGHKYAAGLTIKEENLNEFKEKFENVVTQRITQDQKEEFLYIASQLEFSYINPKFVRLIKLFSPFGPGNREPVFVSSGVKVKESRVLKEEHVKLTLAQGGFQFEAIGFGLAGKWEQIRGDSIDLAFQPDFKTWNGRTSIQLKIKDLKESNPSRS